MDKRNSSRHGVLRAAAYVPLFAALVLAAGCLARAALQPEASGVQGRARYVIVPLKGFDSIALSNTGLVAGFAGQRRPNHIWAALWTRGKLTILPTPPPFNSNMSFGVNDHGWAVGSVSNNKDDRSQPHAALWRVHSFKRLDAGSGVPGSVASAINNAGWVVGQTTPPLDIMRAAEKQSRAFIWKNGRFRILPGLARWSVSSANAINDAGVIAGNSDGAWSTHAVIWKDGRIRDIGAPRGANRCIATGINTRGEVVGYCWMADNTQHAVLWYSGRIWDLGARCTPNAINARGEAVGFTQVNDPLTEPATALYWDAQHRRYDLNSLLPPNSGWVLHLAKTINNSGQILAHGTYRGQPAQCILTPVNKSADNANNSR